MLSIISIENVGKLLDSGIFLKKNIFDTNFKFNEVKMKIAN